MPEEGTAREVDRPSYTAKQIATRLGTDAKTMRKFFRSDASTTEAVGRGGRYEFDAELLPEIREEFQAWMNGEAPKTKPETIEEEPDDPLEVTGVDPPDDEEIEEEDE